MTNLQFIANIDPNIIKFNDTYYLVISNILGYNDNPAYAIFLNINENILSQDNNSLQIWFYEMQHADIEEISRIIAQGYEDKLVLGEDYFLSWSLWNYLMTYNNDLRQHLMEEGATDFRYQDYMDSQYNRINIDKYIDVADTDIKYYLNINKLKDFHFTKEELDNFVSTFCTIILDNTTLTDITDINNTIYKSVLEYYQKNGKDDVAVVMDLIFNNNTLLFNNSNNTGMTCCNTGYKNGTTSGTANISYANDSLDGTVSSISCLDIYKQSMLLYLKKMLGDYNFYCDWFFTKTDTGSVPNDLLIDTLKKLFDEFKELGYILSWSKYNCGCGNNISDKMLAESDANYRIFDNYYQVLEYNSDNVVCDNKNKIKVYGEAFAEILPYLVFL